MSRTTDYILEKEEQGELVFDDIRNEYVDPNRYALRREIEYLEWDISCKQEDLELLKEEYNRL